MHRPKPWTLKLKAKANNLKLKGKSLFSTTCKFCMLPRKMLKKNAVEMKLNTQTPVSVQKSKSLKYKFFKLLTKLGIKRTKNKDMKSEINASSECLSFKEPDCWSNNGQCIGEKYFTEKMTVGLIIVSHNFLKLNEYLGSNKLKFLLIFIISMAMSYSIIISMRSIDQIEDFISSLVWRAFNLFMLL